jgi:hypothetical protein
VGAGNLRAYILKQAISDWHQAQREIDRRKKGGKRALGNESGLNFIRDIPEQTQEELERFFQSKWFGTLFYDLDINGERLLEAIKRPEIGRRVAQMEKGHG